MIIPPAPPSTPMSNACVMAPPVPPLALNVTDRELVAANSPLANLPQPEGHRSVYYEQWRVKQENEEPTIIDRPATILADQCASCQPPADAPSSADVREHESRKRARIDSTSPPHTTQATAGPSRTGPTRSQPPTSTRFRRVPQPLPDLTWRHSARVRTNNRLAQSAAGLASTGNVHCVANTAFYGVPISSTARTAHAAAAPRDSLSSRPPHQPVTAERDGAGNDGQSTAHLDRTEGKENMMSLDDLDLPLPLSTTPPTPTGALTERTGPSPFAFSSSSLVGALGGDAAGYSPTRAIQPAPTNASTQVHAPQPIWPLNRLSMSAWPTYSGSMQIAQTDPQHVASPPETPRPFATFLSTSPPPLGLPAPVISASNASQFASNFTLHPPLAATANAGGTGIRPTMQPCTATMPQVSALQAGGAAAGYNFTHPMPRDFPGIDHDEPAEWYADLP